MIFHSSLQPSLYDLPNDCQVLAKQRLSYVAGRGRGLERHSAGSHVRKAQFTAALGAEQERPGFPGPSGSLGL